ncbi:c-type cytochrome [Phenylobacterium sp.]|uniref:c-type cytochrome n=1 Tax=Phenylobacterium sp. TaxID=1871053 RepID=UPI00403710A2
MRDALIILSLAGALASCATPQPAPPQPMSPAAERGLQFAVRSCAGCHAVDSAGHSANAVAPPFASVRMRHTAIGLERSLAQISREGHGEMPPIYMTAAEMADLVAYIESLEPIAEAPAPATQVRTAGL